MKKYVFIALGASLLVACTALQEEPLNNAASNPEEVNFSAYLMRGTTKAGATGELTTSTGTINLETEGFGVFGYHTDNALYSQAVQPNFMYNTKVSTSNWTYSPIKYWPNEFGENASSEAIDRLTFFAYAPYVKVNSSTGSLDGTEYDDSDAAKSTKTGITRLTRATDTGDPKVSYVVAFAPESSVDLCWGVSKDGFNKSAGTSEGTNSIAAGDPYINVARPNTGDKIAFGFEHALASLNVKIDASVKGISNGAAMDATQTRVYVRSVTFEGFAAEGSLNLNSAKGSPQWVNYYGNGALSTDPVTVYDGRRDGREGSSADANEKPADLNPVIVQSAAYDATPTAGVTDTKVNLFNPGSGDAASPIYVIPNGDILKVTIAYDVETIDDKILGSYLADGVKHGSVVENKITKTITGIGAMEAGKKYVVTLHLGLNSVDFDAEITDWGAGEDGTGNLPASSGIAMSFTSGGVSVTAPMMLWIGDSETRTASTELPDGYSLSGAVTYSSSDPAVATVNASTGEVTAVGPGEATITATAVATKASETSGSASYKVYVKSLEIASTPFALVSSEKSIVYVGQEDKKVQMTANNTNLTTPEYIWKVQSGDAYLSLSDETGVTVTLNPGTTAGTAVVRCIARGAETVAYYQDITVAVAPDEYTVGGKFYDASNAEFYFARGNLKAQLGAITADPLPENGGVLNTASSVKAWALMDNQYDYYTTAVLAEDEWWDHFGWNGPTGIRYYGLSTAGTQRYSSDCNGYGQQLMGGTVYESISNTYSDWSYAAGMTDSFGAKGTGTNLLGWRTLTKDDHNRVFNESIGSCLRTTITISGSNKYGLIVKPNNGVINLKDSYNEVEWKLAELAGYVFLPAAGYRNVNEILNPGSLGKYWSGSADGVSNYLANCIRFSSSSFDSPLSDMRGNGNSVRPVHY